MARFVLIHGAWQGAWCWREIVPRLEERGHGADAIDLPGHGEDRSPPENATLQDYADCVVTAVRASKGRPILVGHSMGGVISRVAETTPDSAAALVYVSAIVPPAGSSMMQFVGKFDPQYLAQLRWAPDRRTAQITPEGVRTFLYPCCPQGTIEDALPRFTPEPAAPFESPITTTDGNFGRVPRYYIECLQDRVVPLALQREMRLAVPFHGVYSLDTDHSPFFSAPEELAAILHDIAEEV